MSKQSLILSNCSDLNTYEMNQTISDLPGIISVYLNDKSNMIIEYDSQFINKIDILESVSLMGIITK